MPKKPEKDDMNISTPDIGIDPEPKAGEDKPLSAEEQIANLTKMVGDLTAMQAEQSETVGRYQTLVSQTLGGQAAPAAVAQPAPDPVEFPDPVEDSKGFQAALVKTIADTVASATAASAAMSNAANADQTQATQLWDGFKEAYPELAKFPVLVEAAGRKKLQQFEAAGLDRNKALSADTPGFLKDVAATVTADLEAIRGPGGEGEPKEPANRTEGVEGGSGNPLEPTDPADDKAAGSFVSEIQDKQRAAGFM